MTDAAAPQALNGDRLHELEESRLAPWALRARNARRRHEMSPDGRAFEFRTAFQRDRDRIVHSRAFRRLRRKTQVYLSDRSDHFRNRLVHTLEVAGIARTMARALALNEDLAEAIALGHDLGHSAFGHSGERILNGILTGRTAIAGLSPDVAARCGGFKHNYQSLRVVDLLEKRYRHRGLNLTDPVREGILKHTALRADIAYPDLDEEGLEPDTPPFLEAQVVALADEVAQQVHDLDDGIQDGAVDLREVESLAIVRELAVRLGDAWSAPGRYLRSSHINRGIVHMLVTAAVTHSAGAIAAWAEEEGVASHDDFLARRQRLPAGLVRLSPPVRGLYGELKKFVYRRVINSFVVNRSDARAARLVTGLFQTYYGNPRLLEDHVLFRFREHAGGRFLRDISPAAVDREVGERYHDNPIFVRLLADHIASMTDAWALDEYERLHGTRAGTLAGADG